MTEPLRIHESYTLVQDLWFEDGTIIFQAENTLYRVYHGLLSAMSSVFKDMLSFPQPVDQPRMQGCPLVGLPDSAEDVTNFLRGIFRMDYMCVSSTFTQFFCALTVRAETKTVWEESSNVIQDRFILDENEFKVSSRKSPP
jgi:hypothetical protein